MGNNGSKQYNSLIQKKEYLLKSEEYLKNLGDGSPVHFDGTIE